MRNTILLLLHESHQGIEKTRKLARESVYWPKINTDIEKICQNYNAFQELQPQQAKEPMLTHEKPSKPLIKLGTDLFEIGNKNFLILSDYYSRYPVVKQLASTNARAVINTTKEILSLFGKCSEIFSNNGPQFQGEYDEFCAEWGIDHRTSSPGDPQSNGFIERQIRYIKPIIKKCLKTGGDINKALLNVRATPLDTSIPSPVELMFNRPIPTLTPSHQPANNAQQQHYSDKLQQATQLQKEYADKHTRELRPLNEGSNVRLLDKSTKEWKPAKVVEKCTAPRSYIVQVENGNLLRRNRRHLRRSCQKYD
ncbi:uncharacterized protein K02A2.6-like [Anneissia japonica]|uniref:uncharacterized protein K02A2.6-like n=1 Tax=Anneissia japonica TaxID=1529436 RepID=UPI0014259D3F|nr:uncharacterized protein K02A2.6-like [Anneissia japonica]